MEPKNVAPNFESIPQPGQSFEAPGIATPEQIGETAHEVADRPPARVERQTIAPPISLPSLPQVTNDDATIQGGSTAADDSHPLIASDDDLIEKEWVDKAKEIIAKTRDDPFRRETEIGRLQIDYVKKRYGRQIGSVKD